MGVTPKSSWPWVKTLLHPVYDQPDADAVHAQYNRILDALAEKLPAVVEHLDAARADVLAFTAFPREIWRQICPTTPRAPQPRDPPAHRRRRDLPHPRLPHPARRRGPRRAARRVDRRAPLLGLDVLARSRLSVVGADTATDPAPFTPRASTPSTNAATADSDSPANNGAPTANDPPDASDPAAPAPPAATPSPPPN